MEIKFEPYKKVSFRSFLFYENADEFVGALAHSSPAGIQARGSLLWANGILFKINNFAPTEAIMQEYVKGNLLFDHLEFAPMPLHQTELQGPADRPLVTINVLNVSKHALFSPLTEWINDNLDYFRDLTKTGTYKEMTP